MGKRSQLIIAGFIGMTSVQAHAQTSRALLIQFAPSVVKIEAVDRDGRYQLGSGVIVAPGKVVTNCHVTRKAAMVAVLKHGLRLRASGQDTDAAHDLCLLRVPALEGEPVPIAPASSLKAGDTVTALGYTGGLGIQLSDGVVIAKHRWSGSDVIQSTNWFTSGASGGALFNAQGKLVGILTFRLRGGETHYFSAPADWLTTRLAQDRRMAPVEPFSGLTFWEESGEAQPFFLRAASLEQNRQWQELSDLAQRWVAASPSDAEAFYTQGVAFDGLGLTDDSIRALKRCTEIDPAYSRGWSRLAQAYRRQGRAQDERVALAALASVDPELAAQVSNELEKP
jgi:hypothetical protein